MAINPSVSFPTQTIPASAAYPYGAAQNITVSGDNTGTPWNKLVVDDIWGFQQALLQAAGIVPSGSPDTAVLSQYLDALNALILTGSGSTKYNPYSSVATSLSLNSSNDTDYITMTNASPITITVEAPTAPYGDTITIDKDSGSGLITFVPDGGITIKTISGGTLTLTTDGQVGSLVSLDATTWKFIK